MISEVSFFQFFKKTVDAIEKDVKQEALQKGGPDITEVYKDSSLWTKKIMDYLDGRNYLYNDKSDYKGIPGEYLLETEREYYRIDLIAYKNTPEICDNKLELNRHFWNLELAFEHENNPSDWLDEIIKLAHIKCGLKVVVGYSHDKNKEKIELCNKLLQQLLYGKPDKNDHWLIILGECGKDEYENLADTYVGYRYDYYDHKEPCFKEIK